MSRGAVAPVLGVLLLVATTVTVGAGVAVYAAGQSDAVPSDAVARPGTAAFELDAVDADRQRVTVRYLAGPPLDVERLELRVGVVGGPTGRLVGLPAGRGGRCYGDPDDVLLPENVANDPIFSRACGDARGAITAKPPGGDTWRPGEEASVRIREGDGDRAGVELEPGDAVEVAVVDAAAGAALAELRARVE